ncbi:hypothetical protein [Actinomyces oris]|jgi:hypothetical protein|nr:hypothetical protein [Actinomyces oris]
MTGSRRQAPTINQARLTANWRLIVTDEGGTPVVACVIEIVDYH